MTFDIVSPSNERIRRLVGLRDRKHRDADGLFLVEGTRLVDRAMAAGLSPLETYTDGSTAVDTPGEVITVSPKALDRASYRQRSEGVIAIFEQFEPTLERIGRPGSLVLAAESIEKPGNLGAMLRTADATDADALVVVGDSVDPFNPNVIRASTGALFTVPLAVCDLGELLAWLGPVPLVAAIPTASTPYWRHDFTQPVAIIVGAEDTGLTGPALTGAAGTVTIPMAGIADSLNASVSLALLAFEAVRQRAGAHGPVTTDG